MSDKEKIYISWKQVHSDTRVMIDKLPQRDWAGIIAITRGGMMPAQVVATDLGIRTVQTIGVSSYEEDLQGEATITSAGNIPDGGAGWLVIDDLTDTGNTFKALRAHLPAAHFACPYTKPAGHDLADTWAKRYPQDCWIVFPWDQ